MRENDWHEWDWRPAGGRTLCEAGSRKRPRWLEEEPRRQEKGPRRDAIGGPVLVFGCGGSGLHRHAEGGETLLQVVDADELNDVHTQ